MRKGQIPDDLTPAKVGRPLEWTVDRIDEEAEALLDWIKQPGNIWIRDFAFERGYPPTHMARFKDRSRYFCEALELAKQYQESFLYKRGLALDSPHFIKYVLATVHGIKEPKDDSDEKTVIFNINGVRDAPSMHPQHEYDPHRGNSHGRDGFDTGNNTND